MTNEGPKFSRPPVIETVLSAQFVPLPGFAAAHAGWYWKTQLGPEWKAVKETARLDDQFETFDPAGRWTRQRVQIIPGEKSRIQIIREDTQRMIQLQDSRYILNWRKTPGAGYSTYGVLRPEFFQGLEQYQGFAHANDLGTLELNQWEMTYVSHVPQGELWESPLDWPKIIPVLGTPHAAKGLRLENMAGGWRHIIGDQAGRLHVSINHGKTQEEREVLILEFTARGPIAGRSLQEGLQLGHDAIVWTFVGITSPEAHKHWGRTA